MEEGIELFGIMMAIFLPIIMLVAVSSYFDSKKKAMASLDKLRKEIDAQSTEELEAEVETLRERIAVLETIVTDRGFELERKISNL